MAKALQPQPFLARLREKRAAPLGARAALPFRCPEESRTQQPEGGRGRSSTKPASSRSPTPGPSSPRPALPPTAGPFLPVLCCPVSSPLSPSRCAPTAPSPRQHPPHPRRGTSAGGRVSGSGRPGAPGHGAGPGEGRERGSTAVLSGSAGTADTPGPSERAAPRGWPGPCPTPQHHPTNVPDSRRKMDESPELAAPGARSSLPHGCARLPRRVRAPLPRLPPAGCR